MKLPGCQFIVVFKGTDYEDIVGFGQQLRCSRFWSINNASCLMCTPSSLNRALISRRVKPFFDKITNLLRLSIASLVIVPGEHSLPTSIIGETPANQQQTKLNQQLIDTRQSMCYKLTLPASTRCTSVCARVLVRVCTLAS